MWLYAGIVAGQFSLHLYDAVVQPIKYSLSARCPWITWSKNEGVPRRGVFISHNFTSTEAVSMPLTGQSGGWWQWVIWSSFNDARSERINYKTLKTLRCHRETTQRTCQLKSCKLLHRCSTTCIWTGLQQETGLQGHSRSSEMARFDRPHETSC